MYELKSKIQKDLFNESLDKPIKIQNTKRIIPYKFRCIN